MSASPPAVSAPSQKRPLEEPSSPSGPTDQPEAKRPALDKIARIDETAETEVTIAQDQTATRSTSDGGATESTDVPAGAVQNGTQDPQGDTHVPDAPTTVSTAAPDGTDVETSTDRTVPMVETQPIRSAVGGNDRGSNNSGHASHQDESSWIHVRAIISSAEAATVIGKGGENVTQIRKLSGAKCTVSDYSRGAVERILTVSGLVDATAKV